MPESDATGCNAKHASARQRLASYPHACLDGGRSGRRGRPGREGIQRRRDSDARGRGRGAGLAEIARRDGQGWQRGARVQESRWNRPFLHSGGSHSRQGYNSIARFNRLICHQSAHLPRHLRFFYCSPSAVVLGDPSILRCGGRDRREKRRGARSVLSPTFWRTPTCCR